MALRSNTFRSAHELTTWLVANGYGPEDVHFMYLNTSGHFDVIYDDSDPTGMIVGTVEGTTGAQTIAVSSVTKRFTRSVGSYVTDGFVVGDHVTFAGCTNGANNSTFIVTAVSALYLECSGAVGLVTEAGTGDETATAVGWSLDVGDGHRLGLIRVIASGGDTTVNILDQGAITVLSGDTFEFEYGGRYQGDGSATDANRVEVTANAKYTVTWLDRS
jgi:hypothetical protein